MNLDTTLARRDDLIDQYLPACGPEDRQALQMYLLEGEESAAAPSVPMMIRMAQDRVTKQLEEDRVAQNHS